MKDSNIVGEKWLDIVIKGSFIILFHFGTVYSWYIMQSVDHCFMNALSDRISTHCILISIHLPNEVGVEKTELTWGTKSFY